MRRKMIDKLAAGENEMNTITDSAYTGDIVSRLRNWRGLHLAHGGELFDEAADEIINLRLAIRRFAEQDATLSVCDGNVTVDIDGIALTDEEREAVGLAYSRLTADTKYEAVAATLRDLLKRTNNE